MSAASTRTLAPATDVDTPNQPSLTAPAAVSTDEQLRLDNAATDLVAAADALDGWYARQNSASHSYVGDGHEAIHLIDATTRELYRVRADLVREVRADEDERTVRADRMIAEFKSRRAGYRSGDAATPMDGGAA